MRKAEAGQRGLFNRRLFVNREVYQQMSENRTQDIQLIKLAAQIEKDCLHFIEKFIQKSGENSQLTPFLQKMHEEAQKDLETFESLLSPLEASQSTEEIEDISLDDYVKELQKTRSEKFYSSRKVSELIDKFYNPIRVLAYLAETLNEQADFYSSSADNIFYENEKSSFIKMALEKKDQADQVIKKKKEIISRFP